jgi:simple sugar transport system ATP-binding protein
MNQFLEVTNLSKSFGAINAVKDFSISLDSGEVKALVGDNGAGKSTIVKMLSGALRPDSGKIRIEGKEVALSNPTHARGLGIETVRQDLAIATQQPIFLNVFLGRELVKKPFRLLDKKAMRKEASDLFETLGISIPNLDLPIGNLSGGQRQAVAIARAAKWGRSLVIMDEPTAALGVAETKKVEKLVSELSKQGAAILIVSHNLDQVFRLSRNISVMRRGEYVGEFQTSEISINEIVSCITGRK